MIKEMDLLLLAMKSRWDAFTDSLLHEEKGAADIVAILVVIVILMAVAVLFKQQLEGLVTAVFGKATQWVSDQT